MIVADTSAMIALIDAGDRHHKKLRKLYEARPDEWILPWAILPEVDYLTSAHLGASAQQAFLDDVATGALAVEWGTAADLERARDINLQYKSLKLGLADGIVMAVAERHRARAIATLDLRHFGTVSLKGSPALLPRDA